MTTRANVLATEVRMREVQLDALRNEVDELHIGFRTMEKLAFLDIKSLSGYSVGL